MKPARFHRVVKLKLEPELRKAIEEAAERDRTSMSEFLRRELRSIVLAPACSASAPTEVRP